MLTPQQNFQGYEVIFIGILINLTLLFPRVQSSKQRGKSCKIVNNKKQYHLKVLLNSFHLNGHTLGFHPQTQKVQQHLLTQGLTLGMKSYGKLIYTCSHAWNFSYC